VETREHVAVTGAVPLTTVIAVGHPGIRPVAGDVDVVRVTVPLNPFNGMMVIVDLPIPPELKSAGDVADISKSGAEVTSTVM
jgi:hypothetical protein